MNRVLLCGVCVGAVRSLMGEECASFSLMTASDGSTKQTIKPDFCENAQAVIIRDGICYRAEAKRTEECGITLSETGARKLTEEAPGLVTLLMQNIALCLNYEGVEVSFSVENN